jgi:3,4-dihydroxy 2-butanone 4-phosphate synthase/GTP cyclohydrolase II
LSGYGLKVTGRAPLFAPITMENKRYIDTKRMKMGHLFDLSVEDTSVDSFSQKPSR